MWEASVHGMMFHIMQTLRGVTHRDRTRERGERVNCIHVLNSLNSRDDRSDGHNQMVAEPEFKKYKIHA